MDERKKAQLVYILADAQARSEWIGDTLRNYLREIPPNPTVCVLNVGDGEELLHLRYILGDGARLHAFDIQQPRKLGPEIMEVTATKFHQTDIKKIEKVIKQIGVEPDIIISRHPRILESINKLTGEITYNKWWLLVLEAYAKRIQGTGRMLVTTMTDEEMNLLSSHFQTAGIAHKVQQNQNSSPFSLDYPSPQGIKQSRMDGWVLQV